MTIVLRLALASALVFAALAPAGAQFVPQGSYQQSCVDIRSNGNTLSARCTAPNGQRIHSTFQIGTCRGGDVANVNGYLRCNGGGGGHYPGYGPGFGPVPGGSYQSSCRNTRMNGGVLSAQCTATNGQWIGSSLAVNRCRPGTDIANVNGRLSCLAYR